MITSHHKSNKTAVTFGQQLLCKPAGMDVWIGQVVITPGWQIGAFIKRDTARLYLSRKIGHVNSTWLELTISIF